MADETSRPMTDADVVPPPATTQFQPDAPTELGRVDFAPDTADRSGVTDQVREKAASYQDQVSDRVRALAETGKDRATGLLDQIARLLDDAAGQVDGKLGNQYGDYARSAAGAVQNLSGQVRDKDLDSLLDDLRELVRKSPGAAVGIAATLGFVAARLVHAGIDAERDAG